MPLNLTTLLVLLLPGFWSTWVYQKISRDDKKYNGEWMNAAMGFSFGIVNLGIFTVGTWYVGLLLDRSLTPFLVVNDLLWLNEWRFWLSFAFIALIAHSTGYFAGLLQLKREIPTLLLSKKAYGTAGFNIGTGCESALRFIVDNNIPKDCIARVYKLGPEPNPIVGIYDGASNDEISLRDKALFREDEDYRMEDPCVTYVNIASGICVDFVTTKMTTQQWHLNQLGKKYYPVPVKD